MNSNPYQSPSQKHCDFMNSPIDGKGVRAVPGIGPVYGANLTAAGFETAWSLLDQFLTFQRNEEKFKQWLKGVCGANSRYQNYCYYGLNEWCDQHLHLYVQGPCF